MLICTLVRKVNLLPAIVFSLLFMGLSIASLLMLVFYQGGGSNWLDSLSDRYIWHVLRFSIWQAFLSSMLCMFIAIPVTLALMHRRFFGRSLLLQFFTVSLVIPTIVAVLGIVIIYGKNGVLNSSLNWLGMSWYMPLYGWFGVLMAHTFFNMPLMVRILLQSYGLIPASQWRLATQLGFSRWHLFRYIEWPYMKKSLPSAFVLVFMLCFSSFAVVLTLGGGPKFSTMEVAIYHALRYEFNIPKAAILSLLQIAVCSFIAFIVYRFSDAIRQDISVLVSQRLWLKDTWCSKCIDWLSITLSLIIIVPPFIGLFLPVFSSLFIETLLDSATWQAIIVSMKVAFPSAVVSIVIAFSLGAIGRFFLARAQRKQSGQLNIAFMLEHLGSISLMMPSLVMATGLFLLLQLTGLGFESGYYVVVWVNAVMALPFVLRVLLPVLYQQEKRFTYLYASLGIQGWNRFSLEWDNVRRPLSHACAYALLLSLGDMGAISLFGSQELTSLPLYLFQLIGSYRFEQGACIAIVLILLCFVLFMLCTRVIGGSRVGN